MTLHWPRVGISERHPLRTRHLSTARLTAETEHNATICNAGETPALTLTVDLTPLVQPGPVIATRVTLSLCSVREPWWPNDLTHALGSLADLWLRRLEQARDGLGPPDLRTRRCHLGDAIAVLAPIHAPPSV